MVIGVIIGIIILLVCIDVIIWAGDSISKDHLYIKFSTFHSLYNIEPENWRWDSADCSVKYKEERWFFMKTYLDFVRMRSFILKSEKQKSNNERNEEMKKYIEQWQKDIDKFKKKGLVK